ncbi:extracellular solute-binding protein [Altererythrobacter aestuarii]|uniref:Extracellular solute-binding protein n=2 Tax=Alteraurantiacibacter aestuarii TaxID=650004 RepID=A0A844ZM43_9SPHN|nr:extracellular solute-binding protein [Alteraurantiacibacter aestuarii]
MAKLGAAAGVVGGPLGMAALAQTQAQTQSRPQNRPQRQPVRQVRFDGWGGVVSQAFEDYAFAPFERETGVEVVSGTFGGSDEFLARVIANRPGEYNVAHLSGVFDYARFHDQGLTSALDESNIPNLALTIPQLAAPLRAVTGGSLSAIPYDYGTTGIAFNPRRVSAEHVARAGSRILIDPQFRHRIGGWDEWRTRIWYAAAAAGQNPNAITDMDAVWAMIRRHRDLTVKYWSSGAELMNLLAQEELFVTDAWSGRIAALRNAGVEMGFHQPADGVAWQECIFVLRGSPMRECEKLLNFMLEPEVAIMVAEAQYYPPSLDPTKVDLPASIRSLPGFVADGDLSGYRFFDPAYWNGHERDWAPMFSRVQKGW